MIQIMRIVKKGITNTVDWFLYSVLSEKQKESLKNMFNEKQKEKLKQITQYGRKHKQKVAVKQLKDHLYTLGFTEKALEALLHWYEQEQDTYVKRMVAWELMLWYVNQSTEAGAKEALRFLNDTKHGEKDEHQLRRIAIIQAECLARMNNEETAQQVLQERLKKAAHPDIYLAMANLEETLERRLYWMNEAYAHYNLNPITFTTMEQPTYDDMVMANTTEPTYEAGKVSVILPAFKAETGIAIAIESILAQTWSNLELLIVDDCSPDQTYEVMKQYAEQDERIRIFQTPQNSGPYVARNIALKEATGEFVTVNDADDWSHEKKLETQVRHLLEHPNIMANTSEHARLTEDLKLYRRGTPGKYIFPNMSSTMFRREPVMDKLGYWDSVRFAADGEFKRRLLKAFGKESFVDLPSGPLSLPRQAVASLTSSSAFGYNGFFMGVRKEYVESLEHYHAQADSLYYEYPQTKRPFPVPEPMWPIREEKQAGARQMDIVIVSDFRHDAVELEVLEKVVSENPEAKIGLVQMYHFDLEQSLEIAATVRDFINDNNIQMLVYGEKVNTENVFIIDYNILCMEQTYIPNVKAEHVSLLVREELVDAAAIADKVEHLFGVEAILIPLQAEVRDELIEHKQVGTYFSLAEEDWVSNDEKQ